jgi:hypothetical protein
MRFQPSLSQVFQLDKLTSGREMMSEVTAIVLLRADLVRCMPPVHATAS